nr:hypothetical protein [Tanacetum cinerariifolium]
MDDRSSTGNRLYHNRLEYPNTHIQRLKRAVHHHPRVILSLRWKFFQVYVIPRGISWDKVENPDPKSTLQVFPSFGEYAPPMTYPDEVEETIGTPIEVEPLDETQLEDLGLNTYVSLGEERSPEPPIKPHSPDSFRMKEVDSLTIHTPTLPHMASFHPKDTYCYCHPCIDDAKKHYGFKLGLLGHRGSLGVDFLTLEMIEVDLELESKEVSFLERGLTSPVRPKEVENVRIKETHHLEHII